LLEQVSYLHPAVIRNCNVSDGKSSTNPTAYSIFNDPQALEAFHRLYAVIGFRYLFTEARITRRGGSLEVAVDWLNIGLTPTYDAWKIRYFMEDNAGKEIWSGCSTLDLRTVLPDEHAKPGKVDKAKVRTQADHFQDVPQAGTLYLQIIDPEGISPHMALSISGRNAKGAYCLERGTQRLDRTNAEHRTSNTER